MDNSERGTMQVMEEVLARGFGRIEARLTDFLDARTEERSALLTADQLAALLQVDRRTVRRLELGGEIPSGFQIGGSKRWRSTDVRRWLERIGGAK